MMDVVERRVRFQGTGTIFKILPLYDPESNKLTPFIENGAPGDWIRTYPSVRLLTPIGILRFRPYDPSNMAAAFSNPIVRLKSSVSIATAQGFAPPSWRPLFDRKSYSNVQNLPITFDQSCYFFLAALYTLGVDQTVYSPPMFPVLIQCSKSAGEAIRRITTPDLLYDLNVMVKLVPRQGGAGQTPGSFIPSHYEVSVLTATDLGIAPEQFKIYIDEIEKNKLSWDRLAQIPSIEDQIRMLVGSAVPPSLMAYTFGDEYIGVTDRNYWVRAKEELERELNGRPVAQQAPYGANQYQPYPAQAYGAYQQPMPASAPVPLPLQMQQPAIGQQYSYQSITPSMPQNPMANPVVNPNGPGGAQPGNPAYQHQQAQNPQPSGVQGQNFFYQAQPLGNQMNTPKVGQQQPQIPGQTYRSDGGQTFTAPAGATIDVDSDIPIPDDVKQVLANLRNGHA